MKRGRGGHAEGGRRGRGHIHDRCLSTALLRFATGLEKDVISWTRIPQHGTGTASLNVTVAASVVLRHFALWAGWRVGGAGVRRVGLVGASMGLFWPRQDWQQVCQGCWFVDPIQAAKRGTASLKVAVAADLASPLCGLGGRLEGGFCGHEDLV